MYASELRTCGLGAVVALLFGAGIDRCHVPHGLMGDERTAF